MISRPVTRLAAACALLAGAFTGAPAQAEPWKTVRPVWNAPVARYFTSGDGRFAWKVVPGAAGATGVLTTLNPDGTEREIWRRDLDHVPVDALIAGGAQPYVAAFDTWGRAGNAHSLTLYAPNGDIIRDFTLEQLLSADDIAARVASTECCRWWREGVEPTILGRDNPTLRLDFPWGKTVIVDLASGRTPLLAEIREGAPLAALALSSDGTILASGGDTPPLKLWNAANTQLRLTLDTTATDPGLLAFAPGAPLLASVREGALRLWNANTGEARPFTIKSIHPIVSVGFSNDGALIVTGLAPGRFHTGDGLIEGETKVWDATTGAARLTLRWQDNEPARTPGVLPGDATNAVAFSSDSALIAGGNWRGTLIWDATTGDLKRVLPSPSPVTALAFSPDARLIVAGRQDGTLQVHELAGGAQRTTLPGYNGRGIITFSPDGRFLAATATDSEIRIWDARTLKLKTTLRGHTAFVTGLAFDTDTTALYSSSEDGSIKVWRVD